MKLLQITMEKINTSHLIMYQTIICLEHKYCFYINILFTRIFKILILRTFLKYQNIFQLF